MSQTEQLQIPEMATKDTSSYELLRVWVANRGQHVSLRAGTWDDPAAWGIMLADLAHHIVNSYVQTVGLDPVKTLQRIRAGFDAELGSPTDTVIGHPIRRD